VHRRLRAMLSAIVILPAVPMFAQINTGIMFGKVPDPSGAVIPGAKFTKTRTGTNSKSISRAGNIGVYRVPSLQSGAHQIAVTAQEHCRTS
jgi:hypothetical protein